MASFKKHDPYALEILVRAYDTKYIELKEKAQTIYQLCQIDDDKVPDCYEKIRRAVEIHCNEFESSLACEWISTTPGSQMLPFIIGGVAGVIVLLAIGIGLFCYCRAKKKMGGQSKTQGLNTSGTTVNSGTRTGTTATGAAITANPTNIQPTY